MLATHSIGGERRGGLRRGVRLLTCVSTRMRSKPKTSHTMRNFEEMH